ncbi:hypothetical protein BTR14_08575 [Rhizobium rhizosphaerae]|uniref:Secreted protein n=1 Tax=Xaviernesmea rhizosphaerae TaxID=1672749 RepID=A0ABX3PES4_9HYPH|nr:hypothetical protein [Xaviernesmea rhizosphaerae]OQP86975.1 hypothetical protein BTR14_08575 [Xaviernesmea rhizosphaerae]
MAFVARLRLAALLFLGASSALSGQPVWAMDSATPGISLSERPIVGRPARQSQGSWSGRAPRRSTVTVERSWSPGFRDPLWRDGGRRRADPLGGTYVGLDVWRDRGNGVFVRGRAHYGGDAGGWSPLVQPRIIRVTPSTHSCSMEAGVCVVRGQ